MTDPTKRVRVACLECGVVQQTKAGLLSELVGEESGQYVPLGNCAVCGFGLRNASMEDIDD